MTSRCHQEEIKHRFIHRVNKNAVSVQSVRVGWRSSSCSIYNSTKTDFLRLSCNTSSSEAEPSHPVILGDFSHSRNIRSSFGDHVWWGLILFWTGVASLREIGGFQMIPAVLGLSFGLSVSGSRCGLQVRRPLCHLSRSHGGNSSLLAWIIQRADRLFRSFLLLSSFQTMKMAMRCQPPLKDALVGIKRLLL